MLSKFHNRVGGHRGENPRNPPDIQRAKIRPTGIDPATYGLYDRSSDAIHIKKRAPKRRISPNPDWRKSAIPPKSYGAIDISAIYDTIRGSI